MSTRSWLETALREKTDLRFSDEQSLFHFSDTLLHTQSEECAKRLHFTVEEVRMSLFILCSDCIEGHWNEISKFPYLPKPRREMLVRRVMNDALVAFYAHHAQTREFSARRQVLEPLRSVEEIRRLLTSSDARRTMKGEVHA